STRSNRRVTRPIAPDERDEATWQAARGFCSAADPGECLVLSRPNRRSKCIRIKCCQANALESRDLLVSREQEDVRPRRRRGDLEQHVPPRIRAGRGLLVDQEETPPPCRFAEPSG